MSELKLPRLLAAAKEFNVGQDTLIEFLVGKGFGRDELKPTAKLSEEMYKSLMQEFQGDKVAKNKADLIEIPKGAQAEKKRKEDEEITFRREDKKTPIKEQPSVNAVEEVPIAVAIEPIAIVKPEPIAPVVEEKVIVIAEPIQVVQEPQITKIEAPELESPKIINKIDLSTIESSTRPKKVVKNKPQVEQIVEEILPSSSTPEVVKEEVTKPIEIEVVPVLETKLIESPEETDLPIIENIKADKIEGPKILGKIQLPIDSDTRPKPPSREEKRKRKRIPIDKKGSEPNTGSQISSPSSVNPQQRPVVPAQPFNRGGFGSGGAASAGGGRGPGGAGSASGGFQGGGQGGNGRFRPAVSRSAGGNRAGGTGGGRNDRDKRPDDKEIDQKIIQEKIRETQAKLAGSGGRGKSLKAKYRRAKRDEAADISDNPNENNKLQVTEFVTVSELANLMDVNFTDIISKCMNLGIMVSINQRLDAEVIELVAGEFGYEVEFLGLDDLEDEDEEINENEEDVVPRAPIVTIMGHVDHGKTSLLDYIRSANVVAGEAGGITQHIGAYEVTLPSNGKHITFLDTPGHEAFTAMRARGAKVTDIAVIVVAADDAVMPQTREAISHAQAAGVPMIFAVNKIDKDGANPQKIYEQLAQMNILVEEWGGKFQSQELSAKQGLNIDKLLEKILLEAELLELTANPEKEASGNIIEASLDKGRGYFATVLVQNGTLHQGDLMVSGQYYGRIKAMFNERNQRVEVAPTSTPVQILGLNGAPQAGEKFKVYQDEAEAKDIANKRAQISREQGLRARKHITLDEIGRRLALGNFKELNIIIKGDVDGSVEALSDSLQKLSTPEVAINVVHKAVGQISESDVLLATASDAILIGFNVRPSTQANRLAENEGVQIKLYSIIYNAIEEIKSAMEGMLEPKIQEKEVANVEIREVYKFDKATVAGCYVLDGKMKRDSKIRLYRDGILIYPRSEGGYAELGSLKRFKDDVKEVAAGYEFGLTLKNFIDIQVGDTVVAYEEEEVKRTL